MKRLSIFLILFSLFLTKSFLAIETNKNEDANKISIAGLKKEHVILALWNSATGTNAAQLSLAYLITNVHSRPTEQAAQEFANSQFGHDYFVGRKVPPNFKGDEYDCADYNRDHGPNRAQKIIEALKNCSLEGPLTPEKIFTIFVPLDQKYNKEEEDLMHKLLKEGKSREAFAMLEARTIRLDAEVAGQVGSSQNANSTPDQIKSITEFTRGMMQLHVFKKSSPTAPKSTAATATATATAATATATTSPSTQPSNEEKQVPSSSPSPVGSSESSASTQAQSSGTSIFSRETEQEMAKGLRRMFGGESTTRR